MQGKNRYYKIGQETSNIKNYEMLKKTKKEVNKDYKEVGDVKSQA